MSAAAPVRERAEAPATLGRAAVWALIACGLAVVFVPLLLTLYLSLFDEKLILFPPRGYTLSWYPAIIPSFGGAIAISLELALGSVIASLLIGVPAGIALSRRRFRGVGVVSTLLLAPLTVPGIALGLAIYLFLVLIGVGAEFVAQQLGHGEGGAYRAALPSLGCLMPYRFNEPRRHKIPRARYRVQNWPEYDRALQQRGSLTVWVTPEALAVWQPPRTGQRGRPRDYSDVAIETGHLLRLAFGRPWRQTEGLLRSIVGLLGLEVGAPDHTTFARRSPGLTLAAALARAQTSDGPVHVVIDATGLKVYGAGEWLVETHGERGRREWRKLHLAVDPDSGEVLACELTSNDEGDASQVAPLLGQISGSLGAVIADGAYDGEPVYRAVAERQSDPPVAVVIPPRATAVPSTNAEAAPSQRDRHLELIRDKGRLGWQKAVGYGRRSLGETAMFRYKILIGPGLRARSLPAQKSEARAGCAVLNRMTRLGMPVSRRVA